MIDKEILDRVKSISKPAQNDPEIMDVFHKENVAPDLLKKIGIKKAEGIHVWDTNDKEYIDMLSGICVANVGHRNPKVIESIEEQLQKYMHVMVYGEFIQNPQSHLKIIFDTISSISLVVKKSFSYLLYHFYGKKSIKPAYSAGSPDFSP
jgi:4-aminobutyrate aminotransferase-like enzyme